MAERMGARVRRARQHAVLRLGVAQSRRSCCRAARSSSARKAVTQRFRERVGAQDADLLRGAGLLRDAAQALHERPGIGVPRHGARRHRPALSRGAHAAGARPSRTCASADVRSIWYDSQAFNRFRGDAWMKEPCRSCPEKHKDFGGCRCQAYLLTGDAANADPVCDLSPHHHLVTEAVARAARRGRAARCASSALVFRDHRTSIPVVHRRRRPHLERRSAMAVRQVLKMGEPLLRQVAAPVDALRCAAHRAGRRHGRHHARI